MAVSEGGGRAGKIINTNDADSMLTTGRMCDAQVGREAAARPVPPPVGSLMFMVTNTPRGVETGPGLFLYAQD